MFVNQIQRLKLYQNIPNPFSGKTTIYYRLPADESVKLSIFDLSGKLIESNYLTGKKGVNSAEVNINPSQSGVLYYQLDTNQNSEKNLREYLKKHFMKFIETFTKK